MWLGVCNGRINCNTGLSDNMINEMLGSPRLFAVKLAPSVGQSRFYATPEEFCKVRNVNLKSGIMCGNARLQISFSTTLAL